MVFSGYLIKGPYWVFWHLLRWLGKLDDVVFYVDSEQDYVVIEHILPHLNKPFRIVARNEKVAKTLRKKGVDARAWPAFPRLLIMARHAFHRFPIAAIKKIGMNHGIYHFKKMIRAEKYNAFDLYLFISEAEAQQAKEYGVSCGVAGGCPRKDTFSDPHTIAASQKIKQQDSFDPQKKTLLFTATWDRSGLSAINRWIDHLPQLALQYNVFVSLHPMMSQTYFERVLAIPGIQFAQPHMLPAHMLAADLLISDTSSVMAEFCGLDKPIITFRVDSGKRLTKEIKEMIQDISIGIDSVDELGGAIEQYTQNPGLKSDLRARWNKVFYGEHKGSHGKKAAAIINNYIAKNQL